MGSVTIRPATADDHAAFARLLPLLGVPGAYVAVLNGVVVGYVYGQVLADEGYVLARGAVPPKASA